MLQSGLGRRCVEATRCPLYPRTRTRLAQDQVCRTRRVRDYWLDRSRWQPRGFGLTAAGLLRFPGEPSLCRPRLHRVTRAVLRDLRNRLDQLAVNTAPGAEIAAAAPTRSHWVIPELVAEDPSPNEHEIGGYAILSFSACMRSRDGSNIKRCARNEARSERRLDRFIGRRHRQVRGYRRGGVYRRG